MITDIHKLIKKQLMGSLTEEESRQLQVWIEKHPDEKEKYEKFLESNTLAERYLQYVQVDAEHAWHELQGKIKSLGNSKPKNDENHVSIKKSIFLSTWLRVAAVVLILIGGGTFLYHHQNTRIIPPTIPQEVLTAMQQSQESGMQGAEIIRAVDTDAAIITPEEINRYHVDEDFVEELVEARRITTYHNKEYWTTLDDGTLVHLNYNSRLIYPEKFGDRRDVILEGEAYFMVAKDKSRQFVVHTPQGDIKVYGTEFYVKTNTINNAEGSSPEPTIVILVKGSIGFTPVNGRELSIQPGQQLTIVDMRQTIRNVDLAPYKAWNEGKFLFEACSLERVMSVLSHWYELDVQFVSDQLREKQIDGYFSRYDSIDSILESIETVLGIKITKKGNIIIIN